MAYSLANIANYAELRSLFPGSEIYSIKQAEVRPYCTLTWQNCTRQMPAASKLYGCSANLAEMDSTLDLTFVLCCGSLKHSFACALFGVGSISKDTLTEQPAGRAGTEEDVAPKILNQRTFERVEVKAV